MSIVLRPFDKASQELARILNLKDDIHRLLRRAVDMRKTIEGCGNELGALREMSAVIGATKKFTINEGIENTTKNLEDAFRAQARNSTSLEVMQVILAGTLAFDIVDRTFGQYMSIADRIGWVVDFVQPVLVEIPLMWFALNMVFWIILGGVPVRWVDLTRCLIGSKSWHTVPYHQSNPTLLFHLNLTV
jgi:hypothetical protein